MPYTIDEIRTKAIPIAIQYGVDSFSLFGSYARGEADEKSDLDFLIQIIFNTAFEEENQI